MITSVNELLHFQNSYVLLYRIRCNNLAYIHLYVRTYSTCIYIIYVTWVGVICLICMDDPEGCRAIQGKSRLHMFICYVTLSLP